LTQIDIKRRKNLLKTMMKRKKICQKKTKLLEFF